MARTKAPSQVEKGRPLTGTKAIRMPVSAERKLKGNLMMPIKGRRKRMTATTAPAANCRNCLRVMSPTRRNS